MVGRVSEANDGHLQGAAGSQQPAAGDLSRPGTGLAATDARGVYYCRWWLSLGHWLLISQYREPGSVRGMVPLNEEQLLADGGEIMHHAAA